MSLKPVAFLEYLMQFEDLMLTSVACAIGPNATTSSTEFLFQNLVFWNLFEFSVTEIT
jgi:hypothetical protein